MKSLTNILIISLLISLTISCGNKKEEIKKDPKVAAIEKMEATLSYLASDELEGRETGTEGERLASEYIIKEFERIGIEPKGEEGFIQKFKFKPLVPAQIHGEGDSATIGMGIVKELEGRNVIGYIDNKKETTVILGAHYDHLGYGSEGSLHAGEKAIHNGADDNASGVSALLYMAEELKTNHPNNNYLIMAFSGEEKGIFGSNYFTQHPTIDLTTVNYMLNMDMVGRLNEERQMAVHGTGSSPIWHSTLDQVHVDSIQISRDDSGIGPSDHTSFYTSNIPVLFFFTGQHEDYHKPSDDFDKINYDGIYSVSNYILEVIKMIDDDTEKLEYVKVKEDEEDKEISAFKVTLGIIPDYLHTGLGIRIDGTHDERPADAAGLIKGDIVTLIDGDTITDIYKYMEILAIYEPEQKSIITYTRDGVEAQTELIWKK